MREIKFRAWHKVEKIMGKVEGFNDMNAPDDDEYKYCVCCSSSESNMLGANGKAEGCCWRQKNIVLMQYTGLKDKNGKEIYEGDVLRGGSREVYWDECSVGFQGFPHGVQEIIGNIHENPKLI